MLKNVKILAEGRFLWSAFYLLLVALIIRCLETTKGRSQRNVG